MDFKQWVEVGMELGKEGEDKGKREGNEREVRGSVLIWDKVFEKGITFFSLTAVSSILLIFIFIFKESIPFFYEVGLEKGFLPEDISGKGMGEYIWRPNSENPKYNIVALVIGSIKATIIGLLFGGPIAILSAFYTSLFANRRVGELVKPVIELLSGVPSVVIGFFGLIIFSGLLQDIFGYKFRLNGFVAGVCLGLLVIPMIYTITEDVLMNLPRSYFEASLALGASLRQTILKVILPSALPGIISALILGFGRAIGETMVVLMVSGNAPILSMDFTKPIRTISATIAAEMGEAVVGSTHYTILFFLGFVLFMMTLIMNYMASLMRERFKKKLGS